MTSYLYRLGCAICILPISVLLQGCTRDDRTSEKEKIASQASLMPLGVPTPTSTGKKIRNQISVDEQVATGFCKGPHGRDAILSYLTSHPTVAINNTCTPLVLNTTLIQSDCDSIRAAPAKVIDVSYFLDEVDTLELRLHELDDIVSEHIFYESTQDHHGQANKPLLDDLLTNDIRFQRFKHKVRVVVIDQKKNFSSDVDWSNEHTKEHFVVLQAKQLDPDALVIFGHIDEIPARSTMAMIQHCDVKLPLNVGIWFPMGPVDKAFK